jgi:hypothetical protein
MSEGIELTDLKQRRSAPALPPRHPDATTGSLGKAYRLAEEKAKAAVYLQEGGMDSIAFWGCGAALWYVGSHISLRHVSLTVPRSIRCTNNATSNS